MGNKNRNPLQSICSKDDLMPSLAPTKQWMDGRTDGQNCGLIVMVINKEMDTII